jgi:threonine dehydrogenase-like Zn-dependent dehydrogenase
VYLGHELVGEVAEVGDEVSTLRVGDRVILDAPAPNCLNQGIEPPCRHCQAGNLGLCENVALGQGGAAVGGGWGDGLVAHELGLYKVPDDLDDETAVMVEPLSVGVRAALRSLPHGGEQALVVGCGTIGLATVAALRALSPGCQVTAMARYPQQVELARVLGADELVVGEDAYAAVARITGGRLYNGSFNNHVVLGGFDVVYDCVGTARTVQDSLRWARAGGTVVLAGVSLHSMRVDLTPVWHQEVDLIGLYAHGEETLDGNSQPTYDLVVDLLRQDKLTAEGFVTHRFSLAQWREAVRTALDKGSGAIKVVLDCRVRA